jgi:hypothetical protein
MTPPSYFSIVSSKIRIRARVHEIKIESDYQVILSGSEDIHVTTETGVDASSGKQYSAPRGVDRAVGVAQQRPGGGRVTLPSTLKRDVSYGTRSSATGHVYDMPICSCKSPTPDTPALTLEPRSHRHLSLFMTYVTPLHVDGYLG